MDRRLTSCENLVELSKEIAISYLDQTEREGIEGEEHIVSDMHECLELCNKLLTYDYFEKSENYLDRNNILYKLKLYKSWVRLYDEEVKIKQKDLKKMLNLIIRNIEDI